MFHRSLCISAAAMGMLIVPAFAGSSTTPTNPPQHTVTRTYYFPAVGVASSETLRISAVNIAGSTPKGTKASCSGSMSFTDATGAPTGKTTTFTNLGTGQIASGDLAGSGPRAEVQGSVQVTITLGSSAPCSLLLTLESFDTATGVTHAVVTTAVAQAEATAFEESR